MSEVHIENIVLDCNRLALENLSKGNAKACLHLLKRAQDLLKTPDFPESRERLLIITFNNLGCYHKACQKYNLALQSFLKALELRSDYLLDKHQAAEVHINICFIREIFAQYDNLVVHSQKALELLGPVGECKKGMIPLAYLYLGKGYLGLENVRSAILYLKQGLEISYKDLGHSHPTTAELLKLYLFLSAGSSKEEEKKQNYSSKGSITSNKSQKKYVFERNNEQLDNFFKVTVDGNKKKISPVKADKRLVDGLYFEDLANRHKVDRPCRHHHQVPTSAKSTRDSSKTNLGGSGRFTPETGLRNSSSHSNRNGDGLPKIRASSSRPVYDKPSTRLSKEFTEEISKPSSSHSKTISSQLKNDLSRPSSASTRAAISQLGKDPSLELPKTKKTLIPSPCIPQALKSHDLTEAIIPKPPQESSKSRPPTSARSVHFRKPSTEIQKSLLINELLVPLKPQKKPEWPIENVKLIQRMWRGFKGRQKAKALKRQIMRIKAQKALEDLEILKKMVNFESDSSYNTRVKGRKSTGKSELPVILEAKAEYSDGPVILIQKNVRMFLQRKKFRRIKNAAVKVQSFIRMISVRDLYVNILSAIVFIQRTWRLVKGKE